MTDREHDDEGRHNGVLIKFSVLVCVCFVLESNGYKVDLCERESFVFLQASRNYRQQQ